MGFTSLGGWAADDTVNASGIRNYAAQTVLNDTDLLGSFKDAQGVSVYEMLPGVLIGGVCTASALTVTIPAGTVFLARSIWIASGAVTKVVNDNTTSYLWARADGELEVTASPLTLPTGYDNRSCCLLCKVVSSGGVATVDNSVQQMGRYADPTNRFYSENVGGIQPAADAVPLGAKVQIPSGTQYRLMGPFTNSGTLILQGRLCIDG